MTFKSFVVEINADGELAWGNEEDMKGNIREEYIKDAGKERNKLKKKNRIHVIGSRKKERIEWI